MSATATRTVTELPKLTKTHLSRVLSTDDGLSKSPYSLRNDAFLGWREPPRSTGMTGSTIGGHRISNTSDNEREVLQARKRQNENLRRRWRPSALNPSHSRVTANDVNATRFPGSGADRLEVLISEHMISTGPIIVTVVLGLITSPEVYRLLVYTGRIIEFRSRIHTIRLGQGGDSFETGRFPVGHTMGISAGVTAGLQGAFTQYTAVILVQTGGLVDLAITVTGERDDIPIRGPLGV